MNYMQYFLIKIDLLDSIPNADIYDDEKYSVVEKSDNLAHLVTRAIELFMRDNDSPKSYNAWFNVAEDCGYDYEILSKKSRGQFRASMVLLDPMVKKALELTLIYHGPLRRKGDDHPDMEHLLDISHLLWWRQKFPVEVIAASLCHDLLEDTDCTEAEIEKACGSEVLRIVKAVSNDAQLSDKRDWEKKKEKYIRSVEAGGEKAIAVCIADKIVNLRSFFTQYDKEGAALWKKFNRGKDKKLWFEKEVLKMAQRKWDHPFLNELEMLIGRLEKTEE